MAISSKNKAFSVEDIPSQWVFENYLSLEERLEGQSIKILSPFKKENTPSFKIYFHQKHQKYLFHDFSSGKHGGVVALVSELFSISYGQAYNKILEDFNNGGARKCLAINPNKTNDFKIINYEISDGWSREDVLFWSSFNIDSKLLKEYNIKRIDSYLAEKGDRRYVIQNPGKMYGYFNAEGELYKIYNPGNKECKFLSLKHHLQGIEQCKGHNVLLIQSSLKDVLSLNSLGLNVDGIASDSETTLLTEGEIRCLRNEYRYIFTLLDNDEAGIMSMKKYREKYDLFPILLPLSKDVSDSVKDYKPSIVRNTIVPLISQAIDYEETKNKGEWYTH